MASRRVSFLPAAFHYEAKAHGGEERVPKEPGQGSFSLLRGEFTVNHFNSMNFNSNHLSKPFKAFQSLLKALLEGRLNWNEVTRALRPQLELEGSAVQVLKLQQA